MARGLVASALGAVVLAALLGLLGSTAPAVAGPARPTADPSAPTPTAPHPGGPPQGSGPGGVVVGGERLGTRGTVVAEGTPPVPAEVTAPGWLVADVGTGAVLAARDPHGRYYPASTLKVLTLLALAPLLDPARVVDGTVEDERLEGSRVGLVAGGRYPVSLLFEALVMQSGNDAANALARAAGGTGPTLHAMNATAASIGAFDTVAGSPSGLDVAGQSSSPYDLALIFRRLVGDPRTAAILRTPTAQMPAVADRFPGFQIQNENPLQDYPGSLGGKTGFTDAARHTFVTAAERDGRRLVVSVMGAERVPVPAAAQAALLLDWGFAVPTGTDGVGVLVRSADDVAPPASAAPVRPSPPAAPATDRAALAAGPAPAPESTGPSPLPGVFGLAALGIVAATLVGRRRAVRWAPAGRPVSGSPGGPPGPDGAAAPGPRRAPGAGSPSTPR